MHNLMNPEDDLVAPIVLEAIRREVSRIESERERYINRSPYAMSSEDYLYDTSSTVTSSWTMGKLFSTATPPKKQEFTLEEIRGFVLSSRQTPCTLCRAINDCIPIAFRTTATHNRDVFTVCENCYYRVVRKLVSPIKGLESVFPIRKLDKNGVLIAGDGLNEGKFPTIDTYKIFVGIVSGSLGNLNMDSIKSCTNLRDVTNYLRIASTEDWMRKTHNYRYTPLQSLWRMVKPSLDNFLSHKISEVDFRQVDWEFLAWTLWEKHPELTENQLYVLVSNIGLLPDRDSHYRGKLRAENRFRIILTTRKARILDEQRRCYVDDGQDMHIYECLFNDILTVDDVEQSVIDFIQMCGKEDVTTGFTGDARSERSGTWIIELYVDINTKQWGYKRLKFPNERGD